MLQNRRLSLACGAILAGFLLHPTAARADTHIISSSGSWEAYEGTSEDGTQLCGMDTTSDNDNGDDIDIKYFNGDDELTIQLFSNGWKIPDGKSDTKIEIKFDSESWHVNQVTGFHLDDGTSGMEFTISKDDANDFIDDFSASSNLHLAFTNSDVDDWDIDLSGSQDVVGPFKDCVRDMPKI